MLSDVQQNILNFFNLVKVTTFKSALQIYEEIINQKHLDQNCNEENLNKEIFCINRIIKSYDLEIVESVDELSSEKILVLINTGNNSLTQKSKFYDEHTKQLFSKVIKECVLSEKGCITETHCLNLNSQIGVSKLATQAYIDKLVSDKWLVLSNGCISLGMRTIIELEQSIKQLYSEDIKNCLFCKQIVVQGWICSSCKVTNHYLCVKKYFAHSKSKSICPNCKETWSDLSTNKSILAPESNQEGESSLNLSQIPSKKRKTNDKCSN